MVRGSRGDFLPPTVGPRRPLLFILRYWSAGCSATVRDTSDRITSLRKCDKNVSRLIKITVFRDVKQFILVDVCHSLGATYSVSSVQNTGVLIIP